MWANTTAVPNAMFDFHLPHLKVAELKVLLVIIRQTLGWEDKKSLSERKDCDWISGSQFVSKTGSSPRAINSAIQMLVEKKLIEVLGENGEMLNTPEKRKGKQKLFYRLASANFAVAEKQWKSSEHPLNFASTNANLAEDLRKKRQDLTQKLRYTKEIFTK